MPTPEKPDDPKLVNTGSGAVAGSAGVAAGERGIAVGGDVDGGIHIHEAPSTPILLPTPPAPPAHFTGREAELDRLAALLTSGENVAITALHGLGGIGKTALAQKLAERIKDKFPGGVLWWSLGPQPDVITALDVWVRHAEPQANLAQYPAAEARASVVRSMLAKLGRLCAIIDDVWQTDVGRMLINAIPPGCPILITTRDGDIAKDLDCQIEQVDTLSEEESITLLARLLGPLGNYGPAAREIAQLTNGFPLALKLIYGLADSPADLPGLARRLREKPALDVLKRGETREKSIAACFALSYNDLKPDMQRRFRALGVFAPAPFDRDAIAAVWGEEDEEAVEQAIHYLTRRNLLSTVILSEAKNPDAPTQETLRGSAAHALSHRNAVGGAPGGGDIQAEQPEYRQHAPLRAYALALLERAGGRDDTAARHADFYRQFAKEKHWRAVENVFEQIDWGWRWVQSNSPAQIIDYVFAVRVFLYTRGRHTEHLGWLSTGLAQARHAGDRRDEGVLLNNIGWVYDPLGHKQEALEHYQQALVIHREVDNRLEEGTTLNNLGLVYSALGQKDTALDFFQQALAIHREVGNRSVEGTTLNNLGRVYDALGQKDKALDFYQQALAITREVGDRWTESVTLFNIAIVLDALGRTAEAIAYMEQNVALDAAIGHPDLESDRAKLEELKQRMPSANE